MSTLACRIPQVEKTDGSSAYSLAGQPGYASSAEVMEQDLSPYNALAMSWIHYQFDVQGMPATALLDTQFADAAPVDKLPYLAWFGVFSKQPHGKSWWQRSELPALDAIERDLIRLCSGFGNGWAVYVRRLETPGLREYYVYFGGDSELQKVLPSLQAVHNSYRLEFEIRSDPTWTHYNSWVEESVAHG